MPIEGMARQYGPQVTTEERRRNWVRFDASLKVRAASAEDAGAAILPMVNEIEADLSCVRAVNY
jgi:hypothetical protein